MFAVKNVSRPIRQACHSISRSSMPLNSSERYNSMLSWKINDSMNDSFTKTIDEKLKCIETKIPTLSLPNNVLVKVHSTSVNPLDVRMVYGYGRRVLDLLDIATNFEPRITNDRYPLTLGRDFSGEVVATGPCAKNLKPGDLVFGAVEPQRSGAHAQYVAVPSYCLTKKPDNLTHLEASSIPFVALTAYSALSTFGQLTKDQCTGKNVLVIGGSGGVGSFAIQLLKLWGARVVGTCSEEKMEWLENELFVDQAVCHDDSTSTESLNGKFDFVLDCGDYENTSRKRQDVVRNSLNYLKPYSRSVYVTLSPPILSNTDQQGLVLGSASTAIEAICDTVNGLVNLNSARWAVFLPNKAALDYVAKLLQDGAITPRLSSVFGFKQTPHAYLELQRGTARGKIVIDVLKMSMEDEKSGNRSNETAF